MYYTLRHNTFKNQDEDENQNQDMKLKNIIDLCPDGKYRWVYCFNLFTNPARLFGLWGVALRVFLVVWIFVMVVSVGSYGFKLSGLWAITIAFIPWLGALMAGILLVYLIWAIALGGKYCLLYELDDRAICCTRLRREYSCKDISEMIDSYVSGESDGAQLYYAAELAVESVYSDFRAVRVISANESRGLIKLRGLHARNRIFTKGGDFALILGTISGNCSPQARRRIKMLYNADYI